MCKLYHDCNIPMKRHVCSKPYYGCGTLKERCVCCNSHFEDNEKEKPNEKITIYETEYNKKQFVWDVVKSVALVETSLAHILNAEGEKLQKAVEISNSIEDLLKINRSISKTLKDATSLEKALYTKLGALNELYNDSASLIDD